MSYFNRGTIPLESIQYNNILLINFQCNTEQRIGINYYIKKTLYNNMVCTLYNVNK